MGSEGSASLGAQATGSPTVGHGDTWTPGEKPVGALAEQGEVGQGEPIP